MRTDALICGAVGFASGVATRSFFVVDLLTLALVVGASVLGVLLVCGRGVLQWATTVALCTCCIGVMVGVWRCTDVMHDVALRTDAMQRFVDQVVTIEGVVVRDPEHRDSDRVVVVRTQTVNGSESDTLLRVTTDRGAPIVYGDYVTVRGKLMVPNAFETDLGRTFHYREYLLAQGITHTLSFADAAVHEGVTRVHFSEHLFHILFIIKHETIAGIERMVPEPHAGLGVGLLLGEKDALGQDWEATFRTAGVVHIIVLSGYNLTILAEFLMRLLSRVLYPRTRIMVGILAIILFAGMVGFSATVVRASIMAILVLIARAFGRTYEVVRALAFAGAVMVFWNPYVLLFDPGFHLSFLATLGLIVLSPFVERMCAFVPTQLQIREFVTATIATQGMVLPYLLYAMGSVSLIALVANVLILPLVPLAMLLTLCAGFVGIIAGESARIVGYPAYAVLGYILGVAERLSHVPFSEVHFPSFSVWYMIGAYVFLAGFVWWRRSSLRYAEFAHEKTG